MNKGIPTYEEFLEAMAHGQREGIRPTDEQRAVICSRAPAVLVMAGAGSGKTATMSQKIAWHVSQKHVRPDQVLGLTFTKKAAGELEERTAHQLRALAQAGYAQIEDDNFERPTIATYDSFASQIAQSYALLIGKDPRSRLITDAERWQIMERIVREWEYNPDMDAHGAGDGHWQCENEESPLSSELNECLLNVGTEDLIKSSLSLASALTANGVSINEVKEYLYDETKAISTIAAVKESEQPFQKGKKYYGTGINSDLRFFTDAVKPGNSALHKRLAVLPFVKAYEHYKREHSLAEFVDYMAWAGEILQSAPHIARELRSTYKLILLDEYQDTSAAQAEFLRCAFHSSDSSELSVIAVGDPQQAIYGWRGAGANALADFAKDFEVPAHACLNLSTAFRNSTHILAAANALTASANVTDPYKEYQAHLSGNEVDLVCETIRKAPHRWRNRHSLHIPELQPAPHAPAGRIIHVHRANRTLMYARIAEHIKEFFSRQHKDWLKNHGSEETYDLPTAAVLVRKRFYAQLMAQALSECNIPYRILTGESIMRCPEVRLVRALLSAAFIPARNDRLLYVFNFFAIGTADIQAVHTWARMLEKTHQATAPDAYTGNVDLSEALEDLFSKKNIVPISDQGDTVAVPVADGSMHVSFSTEGWQRLLHIARIVHDLRSLGNTSVQKAVRSAIDACHLDTISQTRVSGTGALVRRKLAKLIDLAQEYDQRNMNQSFLDSFHNQGTVDDFLRWLDEREKREHTDEDDSSADIRESMNEDIEPESGIVQILTVHSAKGLEWDLVAVPEMIQKEFDAVEKSGKRDVWQANSSAFPSPLRRDHEHVPCLSIHELINNREVTSDIVAEVAARAWAFLHSDIPDYQTEENRRLAYVALTRPRTELIIGTHSGVAKGNSLKKIVRESSTSQDEHQRIADLFERIRQNARPCVFISDIERRCGTIRVSEKEECWEKHHGRNELIFLDTDMPDHNADIYARAWWLKDALEDETPPYVVQYCASEENTVSDAQKNPEVSDSPEASRFLEKGEEKGRTASIADEKYRDNRIMHALVRIENYLNSDSLSSAINPDQTRARNTSCTTANATASLPDAMVPWPYAVDRSLDKNCSCIPELGREEKEALKTRWSISTDIAIAEHRLPSEKAAPISYLTASGIVNLENDPHSFMLNQRRPLPQEPSSAADIGMRVHEKIAHYFSAPLTFDIDSDDERDAGSDRSSFAGGSLGYNSGDDMREGSRLSVSELFQRARDSRFASLPVLAIEKRVETVIAGYPIRCVVDAVFDTRNSSHEYSAVIVDWKTGRRPHGHQLQARNFQLALYRYAWGRIHHIDPRKIDAVFYYLGEDHPQDRELRSSFIPEKELSQSISQALQSGLQDNPSV